MFEITTKTDAKLKTFTPRVEKHGDDDVSAATLGLKIVGPNTLLDLVQPGLRDALYKAAEGQPQLPDVEASTPKLRAAGIEAVKLVAAFEGWTLKIDSKADESDPLTVSGCKVDKFVVVPAEGGSIELHFRVGSNDLSQEDAGWLFGHLQQMISITLHAPEKKAEPIDGSVDAFKKDHPGAAPGEKPDDLLKGLEDEPGKVFAQVHSDGAGPEGDGEGDGEDGSGNPDAAPGAGSSDDIGPGMPGEDGEPEAGTEAQAEGPKGRRGRKTAATVE